MQENHEPKAQLHCINNRLIIITDLLKMRDFRITLFADLLTMLRKDL